MFFDKPETQSRISDTGALGEPTTFAERTIATYEAGLVRDRANSRQFNLADAYDERIKAIRDGLGVEMVSPMNRGGSTGAEMGVVDPTDWHSEFQKELEALAEKHPNKADIIGADKPVGREVQKRYDATTQRETDASRNYGGLPGTGPIADFAGGMAAVARDPVQAPTFLLGPTSPVRQGIRAIIGMGLKQGAVNAGTQAIFEPIIQQYRKDMGDVYGISESALNIGMAGALGFGLDAGARSAARGIQKGLGRAAITEPNTGGVVGYESKAASEARAKAAERAKAIEAIAPETIQNAQAGDLPAIKEVLTATGEMDDPSVRGAIQALELHPELRDSPIEDLDYGARERQMMRALMDGSEPFPVDVPPVRQATSPDLNDFAELPRGIDGNQHYRNFDIDGKPVRFEAIDSKSLSADPGTFQFKTGRDGAGASGRLDAVNYDPALGGRVVAFERADGSLAIVDGHDRLSMVMRMDEPAKMDGFVFKESDGWTAAEVRALAAKKNIQEGSSSLMDTARALRQHPEIADSSLRVDTDFMATAKALSRLSDEAFAMIDGGRASEAHGRIVADVVGDASKHGDMLDKLTQADPKTEVEARRLVRTLADEGLQAEDIATMLGSQAVPFHIAEARAEVMAGIMNTLRQEPGYINNVETVAIAAVIKKLSGKPGFVSETLNRAGRAVAEGQPVDRAIDATLRRFETVINEGGVKGLADEPILLAALRGGDAATGKSMRADLDALGYYSKALEAAKSWPQGKGTPEQALMWLKKSGVKDAEIEATKVGKAFEGQKSITRDDLVKHLTENRVGLNQVVRARDDVSLSINARVDERMQEWLDKKNQEAKFDSGSVRDDERLFDSTSAFEDAVEWLERKGVVFPDDAIDDDPIAAFKQAGVSIDSGRIAVWADHHGWFFLIKEPKSEEVFVLPEAGDFRQTYASKLAAITELEREAKDLLRDNISSEEDNVRYMFREEAEHELDGFDPTKFSNYSLDPSNPTYRETVLHLPKVAAAASQRLLAAEADIADKNFRSGHFPEPNITGHMMTSMVKHEGKPVYLIDQIQSDWGQKLRDGGVRDEAKIADLQHRIKDMGDKWRSDADLQRIDAEARALAAEAYPDNWLPANARTRLPERKSSNQWEALQSLSDDSSKPIELRERASDLRSQRFSGNSMYEPTLNMLRAELRTAEAVATGNPLVNTTDQWTMTTLRRALRQAAEADADYIAIPSGDTVLSYNPGDEAGMRGFYGSVQKYRYDAGTRSVVPDAASAPTEGIVPKNLRKLLEKLDKDAARPQSVVELETPSKGMAGQGFTLFPLTEKVKRSVIEEGQPLFASRPDTIKTAADLEAFSQNLESVLKDAQKPVPPRMMDNVLKEGPKQTAEMMERYQGDVTLAAYRNAERAAAVLERAARMQQFSPGFSIRNIFDRQMKTPGFVGSEPFDLSSVQIKSRAEGDVPVKAVKTIQKTVSLDAVKDKIKNPGSDLPSVFKFGDSYYINDGNHRITAAKAQGLDTIRVEIIEIEVKGSAGAGPADAASKPVGSGPDNPTLAQLVFDQIDAQRAGYADAIEQATRVLDDAYPGAREQIQAALDAAPALRDRLSELVGTDRAQATALLRDAMPAPAKPDMPPQVDISQPLLYTSAANARMAEIRAEIDRTIQMLPPDVRLRVEDQLVWNADGTDVRVDGLWDGYDRIVYVSLAAGDPVRTVRHEVIHALRQSKLMTDAEFSTLYTVAEKLKLRGAYNIDAEYAQKYAAVYGHKGQDYVEMLLREETIANMFSDYSLNGRRFGDIEGGSIIDQIIDRIVQFMKNVRDGLNLFGFREVRDIFEEIESGRMAQRRTKLPDGTEIEGRSLNDILAAIRAYHGSPHDFDSFKLDKIGTGEGAQAYGHGLYFAENEGVAKSYRDSLTGPDRFQQNEYRTFRGKALDNKNVEHFLAETLDYAGGDVVSALSRIAVLKGAAQKINGGPAVKKLAAEHIEKYNRAIEMIQAGARPELDPKPIPGHMYEVNIKADPNDFLDWDRPLSQQSEKVKRLLAARDIASRDDLYDIAADNGIIGPDFDPDGAIGPILKGQSMAADSASRAIFEDLKDVGIPGIRYLDQGSRTAGDGTYNYVVFDDNLIEIVARDGKPVSLAEVAARAEPGAASEAPIIQEIRDMSDLAGACKS